MRVQSLKPEGAKRPRPRMRAQSKQPKAWGSGIAWRGMKWLARRVSYENLNCQQQNKDRMLIDKVVKKLWAVRYATFFMAHPKKLSKSSFDSVVFAAGKPSSSLSPPLSLKFSQPSWQTRKSGRYKSPVVKFKTRWSPRSVDNENKKGIITPRQAWQTEIQNHY